MQCLFNRKFIIFLKGIPSLKQHLAKGRVSLVAAMRLPYPWKTLTARCRHFWIQTTILEVKGTARGSGLGKREARAAPRAIASPRLEDVPSRGTARGRGCRRPVLLSAPAPGAPEAFREAVRPGKGGERKGREGSVGRGQARGSGEPGSRAANPLQVAHGLSPLRRPAPALRAFPAALCVPARLWERGNARRGGRLRRGGHAPHGRLREGRGRAARAPAQEPARLAHSGDWAPLSPLRPCPPFRAPPPCPGPCARPPCDGRPEAATTKAGGLGLRGPRVAGRTGTRSPVSSGLGLRPAGACTARCVRGPGACPCRARPRSVACTLLTCTREVVFALFWVSGLGGFCLPWALVWRVSVCLPLCLHRLAVCRYRRAGLDSRTRCL